jgi:hypothetical protein
MSFLKALPQYPIATITLIIVMVTIFATLIETISKKKNRE